ncbi:hypothetical protein F5Y14DRAFT_451880 [Nemania sp. NC0429]|nr:hypothetical protein F5Y14DRAFT_451880 [Nemania sp. NC0429]
MPGLFSIDWDALDLAPGQTMWGIPWEKLREMRAQAEQAMERVAQKAKTKAKIKTKEPAVKAAMPTPTTPTTSTRVSSSPVYCPTPPTVRAERTRAPEPERNDYVLSLPKTPEVAHEPRVRHKNYGKVFEAGPPPSLPFSLLNAPAPPSVLDAARGPPSVFGPVRCPSPCDGLPASWESSVTLEPITPPSLTMPSLPPPQSPPALALSPPTPPAVLAYLGSRTEGHDVGSPCSDGEEVQVKIEREESEDEDPLRGEMERLREIEDLTEEIERLKEIERLREIERLTREIERLQEIERLREIERLTREIKHLRRALNYAESVASWGRVEAAGDARPPLAEIELVPGTTRRIAGRRTVLGELWGEPQGPEPLDIEYVARNETTGWGLGERRKRKRDLGSDYDDDDEDKENKRRRYGDDAQGYVHDTQGYFHDVRGYPHAARGYIYNNEEIYSVEEDKENNVRGHVYFNEVIWGAEENKENDPRGYVYDGEDIYGVEEDEENHAPVHVYDDEDIYIEEDKENHTRGYVYNGVEEDEENNARGHVYSNEILHSIEQDTDENPGESRKRKRVHEHDYDDDEDIYGVEEDKENDTPGFHYDDMVNGVRRQLFRRTAVQYQHQYAVGSTSRREEYRPPTTDHPSWARDPSHDATESYGYREKKRRRRSDE